MLSGGLDSRLALKIMQKQLGKKNVIAAFFKLPFGTGCCSEGCSFNFSQNHGAKLEFFDCTKGKLLKDYLKILRNPKYRTGKGINPCIDCRIFILKEAKKYADKNKIDLIVTGEVLGERPMSQYKRAIEIIENDSELQGRILRPLSAKLLPETKAEKSGIINKEKLYDIQGRQRVKQIALARKFKIDYPEPAGGCLLCEKLLKKRFQELIKKDLKEDQIPLIKIGRHFIIDNLWIVLGRNEMENNIIEKQLPKTHLSFPENIGPTIGLPEIQLDKIKESTHQKIKKLQNAYSKQVSIKKRKGFEKYKI